MGSYSKEMINIRLSTELQEELYNCIKTSIIIPDGLERELDVAIAK